MASLVVLSEAKNLMDSSTYTSEILRLTPQNDAVGKPLDGALTLRQLDFIIDPGSILNAVLHLTSTVI